MWVAVLAELRLGEFKKQNRKSRLVSLGVLLEAFAVSQEFASIESWTVYIRPDGQFKKSRWARVA